VSDDEFPGARVFPEDARYQTLIRGFNLRWVGNPAYVQVCGSADQVVAAVQEAYDSGLRITARGGGHCYEDFVSGNDGGVIIDLSPMGDVYRDDSTGLYCVEGGVTLWNAYSRLAKEYGVTIPGGSCYSVGAGGHVTAGGYGLLSRLHGLSVDYLFEIDVVVVDSSGQAKAVTVNSDGDPDDQLLLWAHQGGGGGNFGIVTCFRFKELPPAPEYAELLSQSWNWSDLDEEAFAVLLQGYGDALVANSGVGSEFAGLFSLLVLNQNAGVDPQIGVTVQYVGSDPTVPQRFMDEAFGELGARAKPAGPMGHGLVPGPLPAGHGGAASTTPISSQTLPWLFATQTLNPSGPNRRGKYKSAYMVESFPTSQIEAMWKYLQPGPLPASQSLLQIDSYGCQINAVAPDATAVAQRSSVMKLQFQTYWTDPTQDQENLDWIRAFYNDPCMYGPDGPVPDGTMDGCYIGYPDVDLVDWQHLYYKDNYAKLQQAKAVWDPNNVFNHQQSIELPSD
jgi:FAD/FMN-containing dehydrogenase